MFGLSSNVSMVINVVNLTSIGRDPPSLWLENRNNYISSKHDGKVYFAMGGLE